MSEDEKVSPEGVEALDEAYPEEEIEISPPEEPEVPPRPRRREEPREEEPLEPRRRPQEDSRFFQQMMSGDVGLGEALLVMEYWDRKDRRTEKPTTSDDIVNAVETILEKRGITSRPSEEPEWVKSMKDDMAGISKKLEDDERKREQEELIEKATQPLRTELEKEREERERLQKDVEDLKKDPPTPGDQKEGIDYYVDYGDKLRKAGILKDSTEGKVVFGPDGIPVSGNIPAWVIYAPTLADEIFDNIEKRIEKIATGFGVKQSRDLRDLIELPERPEPEKTKPPLRPVEPTEEAPAEVEEEPIIERAEIIPSEKPEESEELIILPERVISEAEVPTVEEEAVPPLNQGLVASEIEYEPEKTLVEKQNELAKRYHDGEITSDLYKELSDKLNEEDSEPVAEEETPEEAAQQVGEETDTEVKLESDKKQYFCRFCGEGPFGETWQLAQHVKGCETAKEAKEEPE